MTRTEDNQPARRRGENARDHGSRAFDRAIHARRRLNAPQANRNATKPNRHGRDPRYAYLTQPHDSNAPAMAPFNGRSTREQLPRVQVLTELQRHGHEVMPSEHVPSKMFADEPYGDQLVERMRWALLDAEHTEQKQAVPV